MLNNNNELKFLYDRLYYIILKNNYYFIKLEKIRTQKMSEIDMSKSLHIIYLIHILREKINVHIICWDITGFSYFLVELKEL